MKIYISFIFLLIVALTASGQLSSDKSAGTLTTPRNNGSFNFSGYVEGTYGRVRNARVTLTGLDRNTGIYYTQTNPFGYFRFINIPKGSYAVYATTKRRVYPIRVIPVEEQSGVTFVKN